MKIEAWMCDRCGRLHPNTEEDELPDGWLWIEVHPQPAGKHEVEEVLVCTRKCAGMYFRAPVTPVKKPRRRAT